MSVLKPAGNSKTRNIAFKIPNELYDRMDSVKNRCKSAGYTIDFSAGAVRGISKMLNVAEKELEEIAGSSNPQAQQKKIAAASSASAGR